MIRKKLFASVVSLALLMPISTGVLISTQGCATMTPAPSLSPVGDVAFYARRVILAVEQIQTLAIDGEKSGSISTDDARTIVTATKTAAEAGVSLANVLGAGADATTARQRAAATIKAALDEILPKLSANTRALVEPYVKTALTLLTVFGTF